MCLSAGPFRTGGQLVENLIFPREDVGFELGVNSFAVDRHFKAPAAGRNQSPGLDVLLEGVEDGGRQTDGLGFVPSGRAVSKFDPHCD